ncbi:MAG: FAD binding domain-containing protein [Anaerolineae bacterium]|nr:FAD binding domain-containing protein [Anaerolineae bacterium]
MTHYRIAASVEDALKILEEHGGEARIMAGGTDVMVDMHKGKIAPRCLVDITRIPELRAISVVGEAVQVGAAVSLAEIHRHPFIAQNVHVLAEAARSVGALPIQTAATWAGNIVQAMPAADGAIAALALQAEARIVDATGARWKPVEMLFVRPGVSAVDPCRQIITHIRFRVPSRLWGSAWARAGRRESLVLPTLNCGVSLRLHEDGTIAEAVIALGPVAPTPYRARDAEAFLRGKTPDAAAFAEAGCIITGDCNPRTSPARASREYRLALIPEMVTQALEAATRRAENRRSQS